MRIGRQTTNDNDKHNHNHTRSNRSCAVHLAFDATWTFPRNGFHDFPKAICTRVNVARGRRDVLVAEDVLHL